MTLRVDFMLGLALTLTLAAPPPAYLLDRLGAGAFADREQAGLELLGHGPDALPALLRAADAHPDPEVRRRAATLADTLARLTESAARTAVAPVALDFRRTPLAAAVAELRARTGIPLVLETAQPDRPVSLRAELPPWEAVAALCRAAGLRERVTAEVPVVRPATQPHVRMAFHPEAPGHQPVVLEDGAFVAAGDRGGAVRVQAVPADCTAHRVVRGAGVVHLCLDVAPLPILAGGGRWEEVTAIRIRRAEDDRGRAVPAAYPDAAEPEIRPDWVAFGGGLAVPGLLAQQFDVHTKPTTRPNPRLATVALRTADRPARSLSVLEGVVVGEVTLPNQPLVVVNDLPRAAGHGPGGGDTRLAVLSYLTDPAGRTLLRVRVDAPNPWTFPRANRAAGWQFTPSLLGPAGSPATAYRFTDAAGRAVAPSGTATVGVGDDGFRQTGELEFRFDRVAGVPTRLVLVGEKAVPVEVPFRLRDVPLP